MTQIMSQEREVIDIEFNISPNELFQIWEELHKTIKPAVNVQGVVVCDVCAIV